MEITAELLMNMLGWCAAINIGILFFWFFAFILARDLFYRLHTRWFNLTPSQFDQVHYVGMAMFKFLTVIFNLIPYIALRIVL